MSTLHFLNVLEGDCTILQHNSGRVTLFDVNNAFVEESKKRQEALFELTKAEIPRGNFNQKAHPVNPLLYLDKFNISSIFRFILSHPDMDHMGGIKALFESKSVNNFWDTNNTKSIDSFDGTNYNKDDWDFYQKLRSGELDIKVLNLYHGESNKYFNQNDDGTSGGDSITILAPTKELVHDANENDDYNDCSYVLLFQDRGRKIVLSGDSHDKTWEHIINNYEDLISNVDILLAPHHGRKSDRNYDFLDIMKPTVTLFGNANHQHLAYDAWNKRNLLHLQNNQGNCFIADMQGDINLYCTYQKFAESFTKDNGYKTSYRSALDAWYLGTISWGVLMEKKIPFYNILNMFLIGLVFVAVSGYIFYDTIRPVITSIEFSKYVGYVTFISIVLLGAIYEIGLIVNRIGSLIFEELFKIIGVMPFEKDYAKYDAVRKERPFLNTLSREYALSRNSFTLFFILFILSIIKMNWICFLILILIDVLFFFSMRKHASKIVQIIKGFYSMKN